MSAPNDSVDNGRGDTASVPTGMPSSSGYQDVVASCCGTQGPHEQSHCQHAHGGPSIIFVSYSTCHAVCQLRRRPTAQDRLCSKLEASSSTIKTVQAYLADPQHKELSASARQDWDDTYSALMDEVESIPELRSNVVLSRLYGA